MIEIDMGGLTGMPKPVGVVSNEPLAIPIADICPDPDQPRNDFDDALIGTMADQFSDAAIGQLEAIYVRANPAGSPPYLIVHGETRYKAAVIAKLETIRAVVTVDSGFVRQLLSNETRGDMSLLDKAQAYSQLIEHHGYDQKSVAKLLGTDATTISRYLALLDMHKLVERAYCEGKATSLRVLDDLRKLIKTNPKSLEVIERFVSSTENISSSQIADLAKRLTKKAPKPTTKLAPKIGGKAFSIVSVEDDVLTIRLKGDKSPTQYRLVPLEKSENP